MSIDTKITETILQLLEGSIEIYTIKQLTQAVSTALGVTVTPHQVNNALKRNRHRITYQNGQFELTIKFR